MRVLVILMCALFASTAMANTALKRVDRPLVLSEGTLEVDASVSPLLDSDDNFKTDKMSFELGGEYSLSDRLAVSVLSLSVPFDSPGEMYVFSLAPEVAYLLGNSGGVDMEFTAKTLLTEFGGSSATTSDDMGENLKGWSFGVDGQYDVGSASHLTGGLGLVFDDLGDSDTYVAVLDAGIDWAPLARVSFEPTVRASFPTEGDTDVAGALPVYLTLSKKLDVGLVGVASDVTNIGDTYGVFANVLVRNQ